MHHIDLLITIIRNIKNISYLDHTLLYGIVTIIDIFAKIHGTVVFVLRTTYKKSFSVSSFLSSIFITFLFSNLDANSCPLMF